MRLIRRVPLIRAAIAAAAAFAVLMFAVPGHGSRPIAAFETWCFDDPVVTVNGNLVDIQVQLPLQNLLTVRQTTLTVVIPANVKGAVVVNDVSAFPMMTTIAATAPAWSGKGAIPVTVVAHVQSSATFALKLQATPLLNLKTPLALPVKTSGNTNSDIRLPMSLGR